MQTKPFVLQLAGGGGLTLQLGGFQGLNQDSHGYSVQAENDTILGDAGMRVVDLTDILEMNNNIYIEVCLTAKKQRMWMF